jgi:hypothetical protein
MGKSGATAPAPVTLNNSTLHVFSAGETPPRWTLNETSLSTSSPEAYPKTLETALNVIQTHMANLTRIELASLSEALK